MSEQAERHWMVDIETLSLHPYHAKLLSIGIVEFNPRAAPGEEIRKILHAQVANEVSGHIDRETLNWWMQMDNRDAWLALCNLPVIDGPESLVDALRASWPKCIWANGIGFDLNNLWHRWDLDARTGYTNYAWRDLRSVLEVLPADAKAAMRRVMYEWNPLLHSALADAWHQAFVVQVLYQAMAPLRVELTEDPRTPQLH